MRRLIRIIERALGRPTCRVCGCTNLAACPDERWGRCWWIEPDYCSSCASPGELVEWLRRMQLSTVVGAIEVRS